MRIGFIILLMLAGLSLAARQKYELLDGDTINRVDANGLKQGHWIILGKMKKLPGYGPDQPIEEGEYKDNRKQGAWKKYFPTGGVQTEITYRNNRPDGPYTVYYPNGQIEEQGEWKNNRNVGSFARYYENGNKQQAFNFNPSGKREGRQTYFHENGQVMIEGDWAGGKEAGELKEYYANGEVKSVKYFNEGQIDAAKTETFEPKQPITKTEVYPEEKVTVVSQKVDQKENKPNIGAFNGNGQHTLYNQNRQVSQKGIFRNYRLVDGEMYKYDDNGILISIEIYKGGKYVGEGVLPDEK